MTGEAAWSGLALKSSGSKMQRCHGNLLNGWRSSVKVGDLVRVKLPSIKPYVGMAIKVNKNGTALVRSIDGKFQYWIASWSGEVINASR